MLFKAIKMLWYFIVGNICALFLYESKYIQGRYFEGKYFGIYSRGWQWVVNDFKGRVFLGINKDIRLPISIGNRINNYKNLNFDPNDLQIFQGTGKYFQAQDAKITIGRGCYVANNVGFITTNHDIKDPSKHVEGKDIIIGENCWIGMNSVILPGVVLGPNTTVGAGSIVTKSFPEGYCVIVGNPARVIKKLS
ncbi:acyltransferase [Oceanobacillus chungangensis]|uniref:Acyltransferase n=1 Tax=Oceanobacillus chungangensis TaxID=1229152 RepID=A0A3D8PYV9_9BACI|nr:DapH/DapD/GlmU-related protein [Oceanobacillus chungangensis]RDW20757.1 acyltransferase [Oceanobacillus chungangensis]